MMYWRAQVNALARRTTKKKRGCLEQPRFLVYRKSSKKWLLYYFGSYVTVGNDSSSR